MEGMPSLIILLSNFLPQRLVFYRGKSRTLSCTEFNAHISLTRQDKFLIQAGQLQEDHADAGDPKLLIDALPKEALFDQKLM
jgi:hypothetical protein